MADQAQQQSPPQAPPAPHPRMEELAFFLGDWTAPGQFHATPFGEQKAIEMDVSVATSTRGHWLELTTGERETAANANPLVARYIWGYDAATEEFVADWYDSNGGRGRQRSAGWEADTLTFVGEITMGGQSVPLRDTFTRRGPDAYHHIGEIDLGQGWMPVDEEDASRLGGPK